MQELVSYALSDSCVNEACHGLEIGCGSGAISLTLLSSLPEVNNNNFTQYEFNIIDFVRKMYLVCYYYYFL